MIRKVESAAGDVTVEPLFAYNARLWLRVWGVMQAVALLVALFVSVDGAGGVAAFPASPRAGRVVTSLVLLTLYHAIGLAAHGWIMRRTWRVLVFVPVGWVLVLSALEQNLGFGLLILGAMLQGFIFLPFAWAMATLALVTVWLTILIASRLPWTTPGLSIARVGWIGAAGVMIGTVLLYIHRINGEASLRARLLRQLDEAQHDLADRAREAGVQEERQRFARDIHDTLAQGFTSVIKHLETIELSLASPKTDADVSRAQVLSHLAHAQTVSRTSLAEIRRLVWALQPVELSESSLVPALRRIVEQWAGASGVSATFAAESLPALQPEADVVFLRATQETLSNVARHANARHVIVSLNSVDGLVLLTIEDNGVGFVQSDTAATEGRGLSGMRERVRRFGGHILIDSTAGMGTNLTVAMPLSAISAPSSTPRVR